MKRLISLFLVLAVSLTMAVFFPQKSEALEPGSTVVYNFSELKSAVTDPGINHIYMGADIQVGAGGIHVPSTKTNITIDGTYPIDGTGTVHRLTDYNSGSQGDTIYIESVSAAMTFTLQNMNILGLNYYGTVSSGDSSATSGLTVVYQNIHYTGTQLGWNRRAVTKIIDSVISIQSGTGSVNPIQELGEVNSVILSGNVTVNHTSSGGSTCFWMTNSNPSFTVLPNAKVDITVSGQELFYCDNQVAVNIGEGATVNINTRYGLFRDTGGIHQASSFTVGKNADLQITQTTVNPNSAGTLRCSGNFTVSEGARLYMKSAYGTSYPLIQFSATATALFNNPKSVVLYNNGGRLLDWSAGTGTIQINSGVVNYWTAAAAFPGAGGADDIPLHSWSKADGSNADITTKVSATATTSVTSNISLLDDLLTPPSILTFNMQSARVLSLGHVSLAVNPAGNTSNRITGTATPGATVTVSYILNLIPGSVSAISSDDGKFTVELPSLLPIGTAVTVTANFEFKTVSAAIVIIEMVLSFKTVPAAMPFEATAITPGKTIAKRQNSDWSIVISDTRVLGLAWRLTAQIDAPLTSDTGHILNDALIFVDNSGKTALGEEPVSVYEGDGNLLLPEDITVKWPENKGILIEANSNEIYAESYSAIITWTLTDAP